MPFTAMVLDVDGTLVESNLAHARAFADAMGDAGFDVQVERIARLIGMGSDKLLPAAIGIEASTETGSSILDRKKHLFASRYLPQVSPCPGARELVAELRRRAFPIVVASSASSDELADLLKAATVDDLIEQRTSSDDAAGSKPEPDILSAALEQLGDAARAAVMVGDTPYDVEAARRAELPIITLRCGGWGDEALVGSLAIYNDPADLLANLDRHIAGARTARHT